MAAFETELRIWNAQAWSKLGVPVLAIAEVDKPTSELRLIAGLIEYSSLTKLAIRLYSTLSTFDE